MRPLRALAALLLDQATVTSAVPSPAVIHLSPI